ncbi:hypothetical protein [Sphingomonas bacterium]|uniref:hypothetical protein n=1 Tax=Sphingomonas bacterium TaxID=1895847 RepID=UPI0015768E36|nr:hypothetical protein [Sphingomonas bacterium]
MFGLHLLTTARVAALSQLGHDVGAAAASGLTTAVTLAAQAGNPIGAAARVAIDLAESTGKTGPEKKADAATAVGQVVVSEAARGGFSAAVTDAENFAGLVIEEVLSSIKKTPLVAIGAALLKLLGAS